MKTHLLFSATTALVLALNTASLSAQSAASSPTAIPPSAFEQWAKQLKNPTSWLSWGADLRVRDEYFHNVVSLTEADPTHEQNLIRTRARLWASVAPVTNLNFNTRLATETREWTKPASFGAYKGSSGMEWRYGMVDNLNVKWSQAFEQPLTITAGRQDITFGDFWNWWLVADGTPQDGSWTYFLDSIRLNYDAASIQTKFDAIYVHQHARPDEWLPTFDNASDYMLTEQDEQGVILYASNKSIQNTTLDGFFIYKHDDQVFKNGDNADIYTLGARVTGLVTDHWQYSAEGAYQLGNKQDPTVKWQTSPAGVVLDRTLGAQDRDLRAFGANARLTYLFKDKLNNQIQWSYEYLSGDDPSTTDRDEMFDILWGRWPRFSELYIYSYAAEMDGRFAQLNNLQRLGLGWTVSPTKNLTASAVYNAWFAPESVPTRAAAFPSSLPLDQRVRFSNNGDFRGHFLQTVLKYQFNKRISGHLWGECVWEGDYYAQRDFLVFIRPEISFTF